MKKIITVMFAAVITIYASSQIIPLKRTFSADNTAILEEQLDMPIISIDTLGKEINTKKEYAPSRVTIWDKNGLLDIPETEVQIRLRGNSTLYCEKKSYKFKFEKNRTLSA